MSGVICFTCVLENVAPCPKLYIQGLGDASTGLHLIKTRITNNRIYWDYQRGEGCIMVLLNCPYSFLICSAELKLCLQSVHSD